MRSQADTIAKLPPQCQVAASICGDAIDLAAVRDLMGRHFGVDGMVEAVTIQLSMSILASVLSIASSVSKFMTESRVSAKDALKLFRQTANAQQLSIIADSDAEDAVLQMTTVISRKLLDQLAKEAQACEDVHIAARQTATTDTDKTQADIAGAACMCRVLRDIKRYNRASLPQIFQNWWDSYGCKD